MLGYHMVLLDGLYTLDQRASSYPVGRSHVTSNDVNTTQTNSRLMSTVQSVKFACAGSFDI